MTGVPNLLEVASTLEEEESAPCLLLPLAYSSRSTIVLTSALVIMRRPRRAGLGVLSPRRAPNLGKVRRCSCLRLIPLPGTGDVLLAPTMISHPLAYVAPNPRHLAPTVGRGAPSPGDLFWTGTLFLPGERSQPGTPDGVCADVLDGVEVSCSASCLADLVDEIRLSD